MVAVAYEKCSFTRGSNYWALIRKKNGILDNRSLMGGGRLQEVVI